MSLNKIFIVLAYSIVFTGNTISAQSCYLDPTFYSTINYLGTDEGIRTIAIQPDGKILIGGNFGLPHYGIPHHGIDRLNPDGSFDPTFNTQTIPSGPKVGINGTVNSIVLQTDGKILVGGCFDAYNDKTVDRIIRLHPNGDLDTTFKIPGIQYLSCLTTWCKGQVYSIALQPDGKILICGAGVKSIPQPLSPCNPEDFARLNADGSYDNTFQPFNKNVTVSEDGEILYLSNGRILTRQAHIGAPYGLTRWFLDGSRDTTFNYGGVGFAGGLVDKILEQPDGKLIVTGTFTYYNQTPISHIARLNADGTLDNTFMNSLDRVGVVYSIALAPDGKIYVVGDFEKLGLLEMDGIARHNTDGSLDTFFIPKSDWSISEQSSCQKVVIQPDLKVLVGGQWSYKCQGQADRVGVARLLPSGINDINTYEKTIVFVKAIPNPFSHKTNLIIEGLDIYENIAFDLYDINGRKVCPTYIINKSTYEFDRGSLVKGIYFYRLRQDDKLISNGKLAIID